MDIVSHEKKSKNNVIHKNASTSIHKSNIAIQSVLPPLNAMEKDNVSQKILNAS